MYCSLIGRNTTRKGEPGGGPKDGGAEKAEEEPNGMERNMRREEKAPRERWTEGGSVTRMDEKERGKASARKRSVSRAERCWSTSKLKTLHTVRAYGQVVTHLWHQLSGITNDKPDGSAGLTEYIPDMQCIWGSVGASLKWIQVKRETFALRLVVAVECLGAEHEAFHRHWETQRGDVQNPVLAALPPLGHAILVADDVLVLHSLVLPYVNPIREPHGELVGAGPECDAKRRIPVA